MKANSWLDLFVVRSNSLRVHFPLLLVAVPRNDRADQRLSYSPLAARRRASAVSRATSKGARSFRIISVSHICILIEANVSPRYSRLTGLFSRHACVRSRAPLPPSFSGRNYPRGNYPRDGVREPPHRPSMIFMSRIMGGANPASLSEAREGCSRAVDRRVVFPSFRLTRLSRSPPMHFAVRELARSRPAEQRRALPAIIRDLFQ